MNRKNTNKNEAVLSAEFCTGCNDLADYSISRRSVDGKTSRRRFQKCLKSGKFQGDICSRIFISDFDESELADDTSFSNVEENE